jgi:cytochrome c oxidase subunit 2
MNAKRLALYALVGVSLLALLAQPVAAAYDSTAEALIRDLNRKLLYVAIPITVLVEVILFYAVLKFKDNDDPKPTEENRRLEITWTVATALILVFVGVASYGAMAQLITAPGDPTPADSTAAGAPGSPENPVNVAVIGQKWFWTFEYPGERVSSSGTMVIPVDRTIHLNITARDWIHAVHVPALGLKQDAIPGTTHSLVFTPTSTGEYQLYCAEYCGAGHSEMLGTIRVVSQQEYQQWLDEQGGGGTQTNASEG